jgi:hypothetical protein
MGLSGSAPRLDVIFGVGLARCNTVPCVFVLEHAGHKMLIGAIPKNGG